MHIARYARGAILKNNTVSIGQNVVAGRQGGRWRGEGGEVGEIAPLISSHFLPASTQQSFYGNPSKNGVR